MTKEEEKKVLLFLLEDTEKKIKCLKEEINLYNIEEIKDIKDKLNDFIVSL